MWVILLNEIPTQQIVHKVPRGVSRRRDAKSCVFHLTSAAYTYCARTAHTLRWCALQRANKGSSFPISLCRTTPAITNLLPVVLRIHTRPPSSGPHSHLFDQIDTSTTCLLYLVGRPIVDLMPVYFTKSDHHGKTQGMVSTCCSHLAYKFTALLIRVPSLWGSLSSYLIGHRIYQCDTDVRTIIIGTCENWQVFTVAAYCNLSLG